MNNDIGKTNRVRVGLFVNFLDVLISSYRSMVEHRLPIRHTRLLLSLFFFVFPFYFEWVLDEVGGNHRVNHGSLVSPRLYEPVHEPRKCIRGSSKRVVGAGQPFPNSGKTRGAWFSSIALVRDMWGGTRLSKVIISCWTVILSDSEMCC